MNDIYDILNKFNSVAAPKERQQITEGIMEVAIEEMGEDSSMTPKQKAFAKLAPPADKITFADKIAGAKKEVDEMLGDVAAEAMKKAVVGLKNEQGMEEGNDFTGARLAAIKAGKPTFSVGGKTFRVTGDTSDEKVMEKKAKTLWPGTPEYKEKFGHEMRTGEKKKSSTGGEIEKTDTGVKHTKSYDDDDAEDQKADDGAPKKKGRPKGSKRAIGAKVKGTSKLHSKPAIREMGMEDEEGISVVDRGEYDREGDMAKEQLHTAADAARELHDILDSDENLPEWVQSKITKAMDYLDTARDYMKASDSEDDEEMAERKLTQPEMKKREEVVKSMKKSKGDFEKRYGDRGEEVMYATATKMAKKKAEESKDDKEAVEETTTSGSVATAPAEALKGKKGMVFGKGVYESTDNEFRASYKKFMESIGAPVTEEELSEITRRGFLGALGAAGVGAGLAALGGKEKYVPQSQQPLPSVGSMEYNLGMGKAADRHEDKKEKTARAYATRNRQFADELYKIDKEASEISKRTNPESARVHRSLMRDKLLQKYNIEVVDPVMYVKENNKQVSENFEKKFQQLLTEGMSMNASQNEDGTKTLSVTATDDDAVKLAQILKLAGMEQAHGPEEACPTCGQTPCGCEGLEEAEYANTPEEVGADTNTLVNTYSDGLDGQKTTGQTTIPVIAGQVQRTMSQVREEAETRLWDLYKRYEGK